jgi:hypothetical protein
MYVYNIVTFIHLLGGDREVDGCTANSNRVMVFSDRSTKQQLKSNRETVTCIAVRAEVY